MMIARVIALVSALLGIIGTGLLFFFSYTLAPDDGAVFGSQEVNAANEIVRLQNLRRTLMQRIGFALLCISFMAQAIEVFL